MVRFDTNELRRTIRDELNDRRVSNDPGDYAYKRDSGDHPLYGITGAANLYAELGFDFGSFAQRAAWCDRINSFQAEDGTFDCVSGPQHAAAMAIIALNILGGRPARPVRHLAPLKPTDLDAWLNRMNWQGTTHKEFCSAVSPVLASGFCDAKWVDTMRGNVEARIDPTNSGSVWCGAENPPPWRVISCMYHVLSGYDAAFIPYPSPTLLWDCLTGLRYEQTRNDHHLTSCTDFDYAWMLDRLCHQLPEHFAECRRRCNRILDLMIEQWHDQRESMLSATTHELYCHCIGWAIYQRMLPERFTGPGLQDTLHAPWLFRLPSTQWLAEEPADRH